VNVWTEHALALKEMGIPENLKQAVEIWLEKKMIRKMPVL